MEITVFWKESGKGRGFYTQRILDIVATTPRRGAIYSD